jgi:hypothetical protein
MPFRRADNRRFKKGLPWHHKKSALTSILVAIAHSFIKVAGIFKKNPKKTAH